MLKRDDINIQEAYVRLFLEQSKTDYIDQAIDFTLAN